VAVLPYLHKVEVSGDYFIVYLVGGASGAPRGGLVASFSGWYKGTVLLQDLDNPGMDYAPVRSAHDDEGYWVLSFEKAKVRRFRLADTGQRPNVVFDEIRLGDPGLQK
jgi:hypothetical protein